MGGNYVIDNFATFWDKRGPITALAAYDATTSWEVDIKAYGDKVLLVKNTGAAALTFNVLGSLDNGEEYDIVEKSDNAVAPSAQELYQFSDHYTNVKIQVKGVGGIAVLKFAAAIS